MAYPSASPVARNIVNNCRPMLSAWIYDTSNFSDRLVQIQLGIDKAYSFPDPQHAISIADHCLDLEAGAAPDPDHVKQHKQSTVLKRNENAS